MSGHSKWANIKHRKAKADAQRGQTFTKVTREIIVAVRQGGPDPAANFRLKMAIQKAREVNMPNDVIQRAIKRASGETEAESYEEIVYEGYAPAGVAVMLEIMTDNRNRTASEIRYLFSRHGGNLGETGCVAWMFDRKGIITINKAEAGLDEDSMMMMALEAGAEDLTSDEDEYQITTQPDELDSVREALEARGLKIQSAKIERVPKNTVTLGLDEARKVLKLVDALEDHDDVQEVYTNMEIPDDVMAALEQEA